MRHGQVSFEYLIIVGVALMLIVPALVFFLRTSAGIDDASSHLRVHEIGLEMTSTAANVYALGRFSRLTLDVSVPEAIEGFYVVPGLAGEPNELIIRYYTRHGLTEAVFFPLVKLTNASDTILLVGESVLVNARPGIMSLRFVSQGLNVSVSDAS